MKPTVLFVHDDKSVHLSFRRCLEFRGFGVEGHTGLHDLYRSDLYVQQKHARRKSVNETPKPTLYFVIGNRISDDMDSDTLMCTVLAEMGFSSERFFVMASENADDCPPCFFIDHEDLINSWKLIAEELRQREEQS